MKSIATVSIISAALAGLSSAQTTVCSVSSNYIVTFYGYPDNSPPGAGTAYNCGGRNYIAGGDGTYDDPVTIATAPGELSECQMVYIPLLTKYGRVEDYCAECVINWAAGQPHIDVWTGSSTVDGGADQTTCEDNLTLGGDYSIVLNPPNYYGVNSDPLFVAPDTCNTQDVYPSNAAHC